MSKQNDQRLYEQQEKKMRGQSDVFVSFLTKRGLLGDTKIDDERVRAAQKAKKKNSFHNTQLLLKHYRNIAWMIECFPGSIAEDLNKPFSGIDELLDYVDVEGVLENRRLEGRIEAIKKTKILLDRVNEALTVLRKKPDNGEQLYNLIYVTYIQPEKLRYNDIFFKLDLSQRHYYRLREQAIAILSIRLWSAPEREVDYWLDVLTLLDEYK